MESNNNQSPMPDEGIIPLPRVPEDAGQANGPTTQHPKVEGLADLLDAIGLVEDESPKMTTHPEVRAVENGTECSIMRLYEGPPKCKCCINWVEEYPDNLRASIEEEEDTKTKALVARMKKNHEGGKPLKLDSIVVQNAELKAFLVKLFHGYEGITPSLKSLVLKAPFRPFFYRWEYFKELFVQIDEEFSPASGYVSLLYDLLHPEIQPQIDEVKDLIDNRVITYKLLWALFRPNQQLYSDSDSHNGMCVHKNFEYNDDGSFDVKAMFVDWDGTQFGYRSTTVSIQEFDGTKPITKLGIYPFELHQSPEETRRKLLERGKRFRELCTVQHQSYTGKALVLDPRRGCYQRINLDGRVMLDTSLYWQRSKSSRKPLKPLKEKAPAPKLDLEDRKHREGSMSPPYYRMCGNSRRYETARLDAEEPDNMWSTDASNSRTDQSKSDLPFLDENELVLCSSMLAAYSLSSKQWALLSEVHNIRRIVWNENVFPKLVLPSSHKDLVLSFVEAHISGDVQFDDFIEGKGLGLLMLLVGDPGLGKTLTAEAVAEKVHRPLYILSAGELGHDAKEVEEALKDVLEMTAKWNAVLLLDECDVFLEERNSARLDHNAIVAVFLRLVEYHKGILIMTTNRAEAIDRAFQSRIHLTLRYPGLTAEAKTTIWRQFVEGTRWAAGNTVADEQYQKLATLPINGREIKNIVKTAFLLASQEKSPLGLEHMKKVVDATMGEGLL